MNNSHKLLICSITIIVSLMISGCNPKGLPFIKEYLRKNDELNTKQTNEDIKTNAKLKELDDLCKSIPLPDSFKFYSKSRSHKGSDLIFFYFQTAGDFNSYEDYFKNYLSNDGWKLVKTDIAYKSTEFRKGDKRITLFLGDYIGEFANCSFTCAREKDE